MAVRCSRSVFHKHFEDIGVDKRIILKEIFKKYDWRAWTDFTCLGIDTSSRLLLKR
jgi:hypothetical protein